MEVLEFAHKFSCVGNGPNHAAKLKEMGYTHVVSLRPGLSRRSNCMVGEIECECVMWCGFAFFKEAPENLFDLQEGSTFQDAIVMERRVAFCNARTDERLGGVQFYTAELSGPELSEWIAFHGAKIEDSISMNDTDTWFYSAPAAAAA